MHTVFINTTNHTIGGRVDALKHEKNLKKLMYVDAPLAAWKEGENGYEGLAWKISNYIDTYNNVNDDFNLIVYVDMTEVFALEQIDFYAADTVEQKVILTAWKGAVSRFVTATLLHKLESLGRMPKEKPIILLELPEVANNKRAVNTEALKTEVTLGMLRLLPTEKLKDKFKSVDWDTLTVDDLKDPEKPAKAIDTFELYKEQIQLMLDSIVQDKIAIDRVCEDICLSIEHAFASDSSRKVAISEYIVNIAQRHSLEARTKHNFLLQCYILNCVEAKSLYDIRDDATVPKAVPQLTDDQWNEVLLLLNKKKRSYEREGLEIVRMGEGFIKLGLAPDLFKLARKKFGLDESGNISSEYEIQKKTEKKKKEKKKKTDSDTEPENISELSRQEVELVEKSGVVQNWFEKEYTCYDSRGDKYISQVKKLLSADEYCEKATELANHHLNIINKLNIHVKRAMSNYSGRSMTNEPPILRKRSVSANLSISDSLKNDYIYAEKDESGYVVETEPTPTVIDTSKRSYVTIMLEYLRFDAGRGIAMASIKKQCDWFINRIKQIEESLKKMLFVFLMLNVLLLSLYVPFAVIQWEAITKGIDTVLLASLSVFLPFILLFIAYFIARIAQKRKMKKLWDKLVEKSDEASEENKKAIKAYDELLTKYIPSLRWVYEYVLDVDFHCDCCRIARAKQNHHSEKLDEQREIIENLLEDLDFHVDEDDMPPVDDFEVDYTKAYCEGTNIDYYSIIDKNVRKIINGKGGAN